MNEPAIQLYLSKGLDIQKDYLEIALCAQHNNGGISVNLWWETEVEGLFAVGECAGTHGITRPGGSALNAGQVGSLRAAQMVSERTRTTDDDAFASCVKAAMEVHLRRKERVLQQKANVTELISRMQRLMSDQGGAIRNINEMREAYREATRVLAKFDELVGIEKA